LSRKEAQKAQGGLRAQHVIQPLGLLPCEDLRGYTSSLQIPSSLKAGIDLLLLTCLDPRDAVTCGERR
jgi:hypothetical protein